MHQAGGVWGASWIVRRLLNQTSLPSKIADLVISLMASYSGPSRSTEMQSQHLEWWNIVYTDV
eukprot:3183141-Amphidinium_carterae.1